jgi:two-component system sensor histidine kinase CpxA
MRFEPLSLDELADQVVEDAGLEASQRGSRVDWGRRESITVDGDPELLRRAVENVVRNAVRYAPKESAVQVSVFRSAEEAVVTVRDFGPGVPEQHLPRIFDAFYRVEPDRDRATGGSGLGLAIARRAVELHRGSIQARNDSPGLCVEMRLPLKSST